MKNRAVAAVIAVMLCFLGLLAKIVDINSRMYSDAAKAQQTKTLEIGTSRGKIYDRNLDLLVDSEQKLIAAVSPSADILPVLEQYLGKQQAEQKVESGKPFLMEVSEEINNESIRTFSVPIRYSDSTAVHLIGYLDQSGQNGLSGIEKSYNRFLKESGGTLSVSFEVDAEGRALAGLDKTVTDSGFTSKAGVVLTIDKRIQLLTEKALAESTIESGCALVMHIDTGEIYALASVPTYDRNNLAEYIKADNSPFVNKALQSYAVGSVFKPLVAAAALENGIDSSFECECTGSVNVGGVIFRCYSGKAHGVQDMETALQNSCNTYFIKLLEQIDPDLLLSICRSLGFSSQTVIADSIAADKGVLPDNNDLIYPGERANFAFGQGKLLATPVQLLAAYHALATGKYIKPTVIRGFANEAGLVTSEPHAQVTQIFSPSTVLTLRDMLSSVVENGNAKNAASDLVSLAGKTGTAQSGIYENGREICRTWFCGFFPAQNPHYIVVVMNEDGTSGSADCAPVFKKICEGIVHEE